MYAVTGATGQLGRHVIEAFLEKVPASSVAALVRDPDKAADLAEKGVDVRLADYDRPETFGMALEGVDKLLLISGSEFGKRVSQHQAVIDAAKATGVKLIAYTSILHAGDADMKIASDHQAAEEALRASGVHFVLLRNGWYNENYSAVVPMGLEHGALIGSAGEGKISAAARKDYAEAAVAVLTSEDDQSGKVYELAGDDAFTMSELAAEIARQSGKAVTFNNMSQEDYTGALESVGLPAPVADILADADAGVARGRLYNDSGILSELIGRPTTPITRTVSAALAS